MLAVEQLPHPGVGEPVQLSHCNDPLRPDKVDHPCQVDPLLHHLRLHRPPLLCRHPGQKQKQKRLQSFFGQISF